MKRIAIIVNSLQSGGAEKQSVILHNALNQQNECYYIVLHGNLIEDKMLRMLENKTNILFLNGNIFNKLIDLYKFLKVKQISYIFTYLTKPNLIGSIVGRISGVKYIYGSIRNAKLPKWKFIIEKISSNYFCTKMIFNNYSGEVNLKNRGLKNTIVIPNCFPNIDEPIKRLYKESLIIITVGRFVAQKDYSTALKSIALLQKTYKNIRFQIVGYGELEDKIRTEISLLELNDYVEIFINPPNIPNLLNNADIYLSTSLFEGTSNSIMEAMNASLPIVATNVGDNYYLIENNKNGFLHKIGDCNAIANSLCFLIENYEERISFGEKSNKILKNDYSFDKFKKRYYKLLDT